MPKLPAQILGEDVPVRIRWEDANGTGVDPDNVDADTAGTPDAYITIRKEGAATPLVDRAAMTHVAAGEFEYVWDTSLNNDGTGPYQVDVEADFGGETDIERRTVPLK